jgi:hypothetical protein
MHARCSFPGLGALQEGATRRGGCVVGCNAHFVCVGGLKASVRPGLALSSVGNEQLAIMPAAGDPRRDLRGPDPVLHSALTAMTGKSSDGTSPEASAGWCEPRRDADAKVAREP